MAYAHTPPKPDDPSVDKFFFVCQIRGCGFIINPAFPTADKFPPPQKCKDCQNAETRKEIEKEWDARMLKGVIK